MIDIDTMISKTAAWLEGKGPESDIVISSRVRLARNVVGFPFSHWATEDEMEDLLNTVEEAIQKNPPSEKYLFLRFTDLTDIERKILLERHLVSREHIQSKLNRAVAIGNDEQVSIMINEEDHLRVQVLTSGFQLNNALKLVNHVDDLLENDLEYAYSPYFGYLTACPTNVGTGIRASVMIHLPGLVLQRQIDQVLQAITKLGLTVRGWYGEGSEASGNLFQISNQTTLGKKEEEIVEKLAKIIQQVVEHERSARKILVKKDLSKIRDRIGRAFGILKYAHQISSGETMNLLSALRTGIELGVLKGVDIKIINELFLLTQPAHVQKILGKKLSQKDRDEKRADLIRKLLRDESL
ncbi:MAG: protein arginine kinase [Chlamydiae bacterium]|nr:protein arginine kinase [Chlamydiota bacterium]MBI3265893.1 protein arginine kinase [Chlamydiota bacterium]